MNYHTIHEKLLEKLFLLFRGDCSHIILLAMHELAKKDSASAFLIASVSLSGSDLMGVVSDSSNLGLSLSVKENKMYSLKNNPFLKTKISAFVRNNFSLQSLVPEHKRLGIRNKYKYPHIVEDFCQSEILSSLFQGRCTMVQ